jgi:hypothetical protein
MDLNKEQFSYWNFSKFGIEFELKIKESLVLKIQYNLIGIFKN